MISIGAASFRFLTTAEMTRYYTTILARLFEYSFIVFDPGQSQHGDYGSICIDEINHRYTSVSFCFYVELHKYQINIDLTDIDQNALYR